MIQIHIQSQPQDPNPKIFFAFPVPSKKKTEKKGRKIEEKKDCRTTEVQRRGPKISSSAAAAMACASQSMISASSCSFLSSQRILKKPRWFRASTKLFPVNASSSTSEDDCNVEECAPEKEVGKVSMEWLAGEKTQVVGTFPPKKKGWTGYVEKDTAGQTNIYSVEPAVYVAESVISSGSSGTSSEGAENTAAIAAGLALISIAAASSILLQVDKKAPQAPSVEYSGPPLSYYISKFKPVSIVQATALPEPQTSPTVEASVPSEDTGSSTVEASVPSEPQITSGAPSEVSGNAVPEVQVEFNEAESSSVSKLS